MAPPRNQPWPMVVPHTGAPEPETIEAVRPYAPLLVNCSASDEGYWELLRRCWAQGQTFLVVEHDVVPHGGFAEELYDCPHDWCAFPYLVAGKVQGALDCTKFSGALTTERHDLLDYIGTVERHWSVLDSMIHVGLASNGYTMHLHSPEVRHLRSDADVMPSTAEWDRVKHILEDRGSKGS